MHIRLCLAQHCLLWWGKLAQEIGDIQGGWVVKINIFEEKNSKIS